MYYAINNDIGKIRDVESFNAKIAEIFKYEGKVTITPLAETREKLFEEICNKTFDIASLVFGIRNMATLHQEGTTVDYDFTDYINLASLIKEHCDRIIVLASATEPGREENYLQPLMQVKPKDVTKIKPLKKEA